MGRKFKDYDEEYVANQSFWRVIFKTMGVVVVLFIVIGGLAFGLGWIKTGTDIVSPQNVKAQWQFAYDYNASLGAAASNWCSAKKAEDEATSSDKSERTSQRLAREALYQKIEAEYDGRLRDAFRAKLVKPADVPSVAPTLSEKVTELHCYP